MIQYEFLSLKSRWGRTECYPPVWRMQSGGCGNPALSSAHGSLPIFEIYFGKPYLFQLLSVMKFKSARGMTYRYLHQRYDTRHSALSLCGTRSQSGWNEIIDTKINLKLHCRCLMSVPLMRVNSRTTSMVNYSHWIPQNSGIYEEIIGTKLSTETKTNVFTVLSTHQIVPPSATYSTLTEIL